MQWAQANNSLLILTWDEGGPDNRIPTIFVGPMVQPGLYSGQINHYNVLRTLEDMYGLRHLGLSASARPIVNVWKSGNPPPTVALTSPTNNARFSRGMNITLTAEASSGAGAIRKVEFFSGMRKLGEATNGSPYSLTWSNVQARKYSVNAKVTDEQGGINVSTQITIIVGRQFR